MWAVLGEKHLSGEAVCIKALRREGSQLADESENSTGVPRAGREASSERQAPKAFESMLWTLAFILGATGSH